MRPLEDERMRLSEQLATDRPDTWGVPSQGPSKSLSITSSRKHMQCTPLLTVACSVLLITSCSSEPANKPVNEVEVSRTALPVQSTQTDGSVQLNPAHGEPGHVCEIPVGEPLDGSTPAANMGIDPTASGSSPIAMPSPAFGTTPASTGIELPSGTPNPAHGEPGHKCEVQVGSPLP